MEKEPADMWEQWRAFVVPNMGLIEIGMTFFVVIGFCTYQIWSTDRELKRDRAERAAREAAERESGSRSGHAEREHELDQR
ncbi:MAG: hypothetical protein ACO25F_00910 [Erythrobacter sp.]